MSIFASTQHAPAPSVESEAQQRIGSLPRVTSTGGIYKTPDPKAVKAKKKEEEKKEKDKKKEEKAKAERAEKERLMLLQRVLVIETEHNNVVKDLTRVCRFLSLLYQYGIVLIVLLAYPAC